MVDICSKEARSRIMAAIRSKNTRPEIMIFKELRKRGVHFQRHYKRVAGVPDVAIPSLKKAVFINGDFWHGYRFPQWKHKLNGKYWIKKIERNRNRDKQHHQKLRREGWKVMLVWEHQLEKNSKKTISKIINFLKRAR